MYVCVKNMLYYTQDTQLGYYYYYTIDISTSDHDYV